MGRVVPFKEIKNLPTKETFPNAIAELRKDLGKLKEEGLIRGAMLYGSSVLNTYTLRSDIDCIVISKSGQEERIDSSLAQIYSHFRTSYGIPVQFVHYSDEDVKEGVHSITPHLYTHLKMVEEEAKPIGESPVSLIHEKQDIIHDARECLVYMFNTLKRKGMVELKYHREEQDGEYFKILQKAVEMPANAIRTLFAASNGWPVLCGKPTDRTPHIYLEYGKCLNERRDLNAMLDSIVKLDKQYTALLECLRAKPSEPRKDEYHGMLLMLENAVPMATSFIKENLRLFSHPA